MCEKTKILWHDLWLEGSPQFGVAFHNGQNVFFRKMGDKYALYSFLNKESEEKAFAFHEEFRKNNGGYQDHDPALYSLPLFNKVSIIRAFFDYDSNIEKEEITFLEKKDFEFFYPPNKATYIPPNSEKN